MDKLIINTAAADYTSAIRAFIRHGFAVDGFTIYNDLLIVEISSHKDVAVSNCDFAIIAQSIYDIVTVLGTANVKMQCGDVAFTIAITADDCNAVTDIVTLDYVYDITAPAVANQAKSFRAEQLAHCYAIVRAEQLAEDIAFNIHFNGCKKRIYDIGYAQYDELTLRNTLAQFGIASDFISNKRNLVIA